MALSAKTLCLLLSAVSAAAASDHPSGASSSHAASTVMPFSVQDTAANLVMAAADPRPALTGKNIVDEMKREYAGHRVEYYNKLIASSSATAAMKGFKTKFLSLQADINICTTSMNNYLSRIWPEVNSKDCVSLHKRITSTRTECYSFAESCEIEISKIAARIISIKMPENISNISNQTKQNQLEQVREMQDNLMLEASLLKYMKEKSVNDVASLELDVLENHCKNLETYEQR